MLQRIRFGSIKFYHTDIEFRNRRIRQFYNKTFHVERIYTYRLKICAESKAISEGQALHSHVIKLLAEPQTTVLNSLANMYCKCGCISLAEQVFDEMPDRDIVSWNTMISGYLSTGYTWNALNWFKVMLGCGVVPDQFSLNSVIKACFMNGELSGGVQVHGLIVKLGLCDNAFVSNGLIELYDEFNCFDESVNVFDALVYKDVAVINTMIRVYVKMGNVEEAFEKFRLLFSDTRGPMRATFVNLLCALSGYESLKEGLLVHGLIIKLGLEGQGDVENSLVRMYCSCGALNEAFDLLLYLDSKNVMSWTTLISQFNIHGCFQEAMHVFQWLHHDKVVALDEFMLVCILSASAASKCLCLGTQIHSIIIRTGIVLHKGIGAALMDMYSNCFCLEDMYKVLQQVGRKCDLLIWTTVISGNVHIGFPMEALKYFSQMLNEGVRPDTVACVSLLSGCTGLQTIEHGEMIHAYVTKSGNGTKSSVQTALISLYANFGCFNSAEKILARRIEYDVVSVTALISGYAKFGYGIEAFFWFRNMLREGISPNNFTLASALMASTKSTAISTGRSLHNLIIKVGMEDDNFVASSLIDMYSKCGAIEDAVHYFSRTHHQDIVVWNSLLAGHAHHGNGEEVLKAFDKMQTSGIKPDRITFLSVLSGCRHGALTDKVMEYFCMMRDAYGISPMVEHYACVIDSLGRAGLFKKAVKLIEALSFSPCMLILRSLLSSCILHGRSQLGLAVVAKMIVLGGDEVATYALFSKLCATDERWGDTLKARELMKKKVGQPKKVGTSWIESTSVPS
jgi:pentatricopeptide repeat protein